MAFGRLDNWSRRAAAVFAVAASALGLSGCATEYPQSIFGPVTSLGVEVNALFSLIFWLTMAVMVIVMTVLLFIIVRYRERPDGEPKKIYGNTVAEILWTAGPAVIVAILLVPTVDLIFDTYRQIEGDGLVVEAIGHQWWWEYRFPELDLVTANQLHLPANTPIEVRTYTADVLHSWWIPAFGAKRDNFPPRPEVTGEQPPNWHALHFVVEEPGEYSGQCAEFCGLSHAIMRTRVVVHPEDGFEAWVAAMREPGVPPGVPAPEVAAGPDAAPEAGDEPELQPVPAGVAAPGAAQEEGLGAQEPEEAPTLTEEPEGRPQERPAARQFPDTLVERGYRVFTQRACVACHAVAGTTARGRIGPDLTRFGERWSIGAGLMPNNFENLQAWIRDPSALKPGAMMPGTRSPGGGLPPTGLSDEDVEAVAAYLLSLR